MLSESSSDMILHAVVTFCDVVAAWGGRAVPFLLLRFTINSPLALGKKKPASCAVIGCVVHSEKQRTNQTVSADIPSHSQDRRRGLILNAGGKRKTRWSARVSLLVSDARSDHGGQRE